MLHHFLAANGDNPITQFIELASKGIELLAVLIILIALLYATLRFLYAILFQTRRVQEEGRRDYERYKVFVGSALLLGLEILVAADIVRTIALDATLESVATLGILVVIRTFLSWSIDVEIEGRWPWQQK